MEPVAHMNPIEQQLGPVVSELLAQLAVDPFAVNNGFENLSFADIGLILEEPIGEDPQLTDSFDACKSIYCLILIELELSGYEDLPNLLQQNTLRSITQFEAPNIDSTHSPETPPQILELTTGPTPPEGTQPSDLSDNFLKIADFFGSPDSEKTLNVTHETKDRALIHFLISACEITVFGLLKDDLIQFWPSRQDKILALLRGDSFSFSEEVFNQFEDHQRRYPQWLFDDRFPKLGALHCLKYLTLTKSFDAFHPTAFELGTFIYFWGALQRNHGQSSEILSSLSTLTAENLIEVSFRLFRLDRIKAIGLNFNRELPPHLTQLVQEDTHQIRHLLRSQQIQSPEKNVA